MVMIGKVSIEKKKHKRGHHALNDTISTCEVQPDTAAHYADQDYSEHTCLAGHNEHRLARLALHRLFILQILDLSNKSSIDVPVPHCYSVPHLKRLKEIRGNEGHTFGVYNRLVAAFS